MLRNTIYNNRLETLKLPKNQLYILAGHSQFRMYKVKEFVIFDKMRKFLFASIILICVSLFVHQFRECIERYYRHETSIQVELKRFVIIYSIL